MIKATRMRLINWHNFKDNTIEFQNSTFFVGLNAVGKTTIIDAFRYCLTTSKDFNAAGSKRSDRTLQGCIHQKQRSGDYDRPGHVVAFVAIEFLDTEKEKRFVIIVRVESLSPEQELKNINQDWFISKLGYSLDDVKFLMKSGEKRVPMPRDEFKLANKTFLDHPSTQAEAKRRILRTTGIGDVTSQNGKKFYEVFNKGTNLRDIDQIQSFIKEYILREPEVHVDKLYEDMKALENLQTTLAESERRASSLREIIDVYDEVEKADREYHILDLTIKKARVLDATESADEKQKIITETEFKLKRLNTEIKKKQKEVDAARAEWDKAREKRDRNEDYNSIADLQNDLAILQQEEDDLRTNAAKFDAAMEEISGLVADLISCNVEGCADIAVPAADSADFDRELSAVEYSLKPVSESLIVKIADVSGRIKENSERRAALSAEIKELKSGRMVYRDEDLNVKNAINASLNEHGYAASAKFLCEYLEMEKPEWQDALESYLNTQRFYIVVPEKQYQIAKEVFISLGEKVGNAGLLDTPSIVSLNAKSSESDVLTLADTIRVENRAVSAYVQFRLGDVICCDDAKDLEKHPKSVTKDRFRYQGFILQRMKKTDLFIGQDAIAKRLADAEAELTERIDLDLKLQTEYSKITAASSRYNTFASGSGFNDLAVFATARADAERKFAERSALKSQIDKIKKSAILRGLIDRVEVCENRLNTLQDELIEAFATEKKTGEDLDTLTTDLSLIEKKKEQAESILDHACRQFPTLVEDMETRYQKMIIQYKSPAMMVRNIEQGSVLPRREAEKDNLINNTLMPLQSQFSAAYCTDYLPGVEGEQQYRDAYANLVKIELERHKNNLIEARKRCKERFKSDVLYRLKDDIEEAKRDIKSLNRVMESLRYGEESYRFYIDASSNSELNAYYNLIMREDNRPEAEQLGFDSFGSEAEEFAAQTDSFMTRIIEEVEMRSRQEVSGERVTGLSVASYADYRTYLDYDIIVKNHVTGKESKLSKVGGSGSGGENQAPFYVAICASLLNIYRQSGNCVRLILLDEAFNKMTGDRIKAMMKMFSDLNMQLILTSTEEKTATIRPFCDLTYSIVKKGSQVDVEDFTKVEEKYAELRERDRQQTT